MKNKARRFLGLLLAVILLVSALPVGASASMMGAVVGSYFNAGEPTFTYVITELSPTGNTVKLYQDEIMQSYKDYTGQYEIPEQVINPTQMRTYAVTEIGGARGAVAGALENVPLRSIILPKTILTIGNRAFLGCTSLQEIVFPTSVVNLAPDAFVGVNLTKLTLDVCQETTLAGDGSYRVQGKGVPVFLPAKPTDLQVRAALTVSSQVTVPGDTRFSGGRITVQGGASLELQGELSGNGVIEVANNGTLTLGGTAAAYTGAIRLVGENSRIVNSTRSAVTVLNSRGKSVIVQPGETRTGAPEPVEPDEIPDQSVMPKITANYGGSVTVKEDGKVIVIVPYPGYHVEEVVINGLSMGSLTRYEFMTASSENTVDVTFALGNPSQGPDEPIVTPTTGFRDVSPFAPYAADISFLVNNGIFQGVGGGRFEPNTKTTRAMFVCLLKRLEVYGRDFKVTPKGRTEIPIDVKEDSWYAESAIWAASTGIFPLTGKTFRPNDPITREEVALCLRRFTHARGYAAYVQYSDILEYQDLKYLTDTSRKAVAWAASNGYLPVRQEGMADPIGPMTRAEMAQCLARYLRVNA